MFQSSCRTSVAFEEARRLLIAAHARRLAAAEFINARAWVALAEAHGDEELATFWRSRLLRLREVDV